jgi:hypothetical protein
MISNPSDFLVGGPIYLYPVSHTALFSCNRPQMILWLTALKDSLITPVLRDVPGPYQRRSSSLVIMGKAVSLSRGSVWFSPESSCECGRD